MFISVIIPVYNSMEGLEQTLIALIDQTSNFRIEYEIIIVDNNSTDNTMNIAYQYKRYNNIKTFQESKQSSYAARNKGIDEAKGDILCFIDANVRVENDFIKNISKYFIEKSEVDYAGVNVQLKKENQSVFSDYDSLISFNVKNSIENGNYTPTVTLIVRRRVIDSVGKFDERFESGGDVEFGKRVYKAGFKQEYIHDIKVTHPTRSTFRAHSKKAKRVGRGFAEQLSYYPDMFNYKVNYFKKIKLYLPHNPFTLHKYSKKRNLRFSILYCTLLSLINTPIAFFKLIGFNEKKNKI